MDSKFHQIANGNRHGHNDPWKIHLSKNSCIAPKCIGSTRETGRKVIPGSNPGKVKKKRRCTARTNASQIVEHQGKNNRSKKRLYKIP